MYLEKKVYLCLEAMDNFFLGSFQFTLAVQHSSGQSKCHSSLYTEYIQKNMGFFTSLGSNPAQK